MKTLLVVEHDSSQVSAATLSAITAARQLGGELDLLVLGDGVAGVASAAARIEGVARVRVAEAAALAHSLPENVAPLLQQLAPEYAAVVAPATTLGKNVLPRLAAVLDVPMISEVTRVVDAVTFVRPMYAGSINATVQVDAGLKLLTVRQTAFAKAQIGTATAPVEPVGGAVDTGLTQWVSHVGEQSARPQLATARVVVSGGRSLGSAERFHQVLEPLADKLGGAVGATRAAVDAGFAPNEWQVGQTGTVIAPQLYIALGVSGAAQHIAGIKDSQVIVAVNHDPDAPIFQWADYGLVGDLFEAADALQRAL